MRRKNEKHDPELDGIAERMRAERPEASPLELDQIKLSAMSRAKAATGRANPRRLVVAALTVGLMAAGTGGVLAAGGSGGAAGNAASAQYSSTTIACGNGNGSNNGNGNGEGNGNENGNGSGNFNCNNNSFNNSGNTVNNIVNNYNSGTTTVTASESAALGVAGTSVKKAKTSSRRLSIHVKHKGKLRRVSISVNGKHLKTLSGKKASANIVLANLPCGTGPTTVSVTVTLSSGKVVTESHTYHLCT
ncbi:MAG TPA: hypothetical protein VIC06_03815 [Solirubrobacteraceae bacterium]|jgi:hypothetical protein